MLELIEPYREMVIQWGMTAGIYLLIFVMTMFIARYTKVTMKYLISKVSKTYAGFFSNIIQLVVYGIGFVVAAITTNIDSTILLAGLAILTAGFALSIDGSVKDVIAGFKILLFRYYDVGQTISFDNMKGVVLEINAFSTKLNVQPMGLVIANNSKIIDGIITNHSALEGIRYEVLIPIFGKHDRKYAISEIINLVSMHRDIETDKTKVFHQWINGNEVYTVRLSIREYGKRELVGSQISIAVSDKLEELGLTLGTVTNNSRIR